jgi:uridylate kinase
MTKNSYRRILLKISGEALMGDAHPIHSDALKRICTQIQELTASGIEVAIVIGGGNIFRGNQADSFGMGKIPADEMGMLATVINGIALKESLQKFGIETDVMSSFDCPFVSLFHWEKARKLLSQKQVLIFVGGTGSPFFTTDSCAALRASEIQADLLIKATKVDGVYDKDPMKHPDAIRYKQLTFSEVLAQKLEVMDATAFALCAANQIPICVCSLWSTHSLKEVLHNKSLGTWVE